MVSQILKGYTSEPKKRSTSRHCLGGRDYWAEASAETQVRFDGEEIVVETTADEVHGECLRLIKPEGHHGSATIAEDQVVEGDFRDHIDHGECSCIGEEQCQLCCTHKDLMGIPREKFHIVERKPGIMGEILVIGMTTQTAQAFGFR